MPHLETQYLFSQLFWLAIVFTLIYAFVSLYFFPRVGRIVEGRKAKVKSDLIKADELVKEQAILKSEMDALLAKVREEGAAVKKKALAEAEDQIASELSKVDRELAKKIHADEEKLLRLKNQMMKEIDVVADEIATDLVHIVKKSMLASSK